ncbi:MAG: leucine-rich repeat domain-containing protein [Clostridia bacterium]|nr:leucine-rich repeat domain-containing protein [Clostridia bacterium]
MSNNDFIIKNNVLTEYTGTCDNIIIPDTVTKIKKSAFHNQFIKTVIIPQSVTEIGECAFQGCQQLEKIEFLGADVRIGSHAFAVCNRLSHVNLPEGLTAIRDGLFANCKNLTSVKLPANVESIGKHAFEGCTKLESINVPEHTKLGEAAFQDCDGLTDKDGFVIIGNVLFHYNGRKHDVVIPDHVSKIDWNAFFHYIKLSITTHSKELPLSMDSFRWNVKLTIHAPLGSCAEQFARENNVPFVEI